MPGWTDFTGQTTEDLQGWGWLNAIHPDDREQTAEKWNAAVTNRTPYEVEQLRRPTANIETCTSGEYPFLTLQTGLANGLACTLT